MDNSATYTLNINSNGEAVINKIATACNGTLGKVNKLAEAMKSMGDCAFAMNNLKLGLENLSASLDNAIAPGVVLQTSLLDLSAITGQTGEGLKQIEKAARKTAKVFGGSAAQSVESYKLILSQLSPEIAKVPEALSGMGTTIATLSKTMGGNTTAAAEVLTTAMNQFQVSLEDPIAASRTMNEMMNVMAAAAKEGSAELPQIKTALEQCGMAAKMAGVSFAETNAAIQVLDKAGKKGSEGGIALRNVMATLAQGRFLPKDVQEELQAAGVDVKTLTNNSLSMTERLRPLQKVMGDSALITKLFGKENSNSALALLSGIDQMQEYEKAIQGTNTAYDQAQTIMGSYAEKMSRMRAKLDDLKIGFFNLIEGIMPTIKSIVVLFQGVTSIMTGANAIHCFWTNALMVALREKVAVLWGNVKAMIANITTGSIYTGIILAAKGAVDRLKNSVRSLTSVQGIYAGITGIATLVTHGFALAIKAVGKAICSIPIIGWIAAAISAIIAVITILWNKCEGFRRIVFGVWEVIKTVFSFIGQLFIALWQNVIKPYILFWYELFKTVADAIWGVIQWCWDGIKNGFMTVVNAIGTAAGVIWEYVSMPFVWLWDKIGGFGSFIVENIWNPIASVFSGVWDFVKGIFDKISDKISAVFRPLKNLWAKITGSYEEGAEKGSASYAQSHQAETGIAPVTLPGTTNAALIPTNQTTSPASVQQSSESAVTGGTKSTNVTINLSKLMDNVNIYAQEFRDGLNDLDGKVLESMMRVLTIAQSSAG